MDYEKNQAYILVGALIIILGLMGWQILSGLVADQSSSGFIIIYTDCLHGSVDGNDGSLLFPSFISMIQKTRYSTKNSVLLLDCGDSLYGQSLVTSTDGELMVDLMNLAGYDAIAVGDFDLNYNILQLGQLENRAEFPFLCANLYDKNDTLLFKPYIIKEVNGSKVGVFSVMSNEATSAIHPKIIDKIKIRDVVETSRDVVRELKSENVDVIVCLAHFFLNEGLSNPYTSESFARDVPGIDLIIDDNTEHVSGGLWVDDTLIVQSGSRGMSVGHVDIVRNQNKPTSMYSKTISADSIKDVPNQTAVDRIAQTRRNYDLIKNEIIGSADSTLVGNKSEMRSGLTNLGCLVADSIRWSAKADVAFISSSSILNSIDKGPVTRGQVESALPLKDDIVVKEMTGNDIIRTIEKSLENYPDESPRFLQFSGLSVVVNTTHPDKKIKCITINGEPVASAQRYHVAMTEYLAFGGLHFQEISQSKTVGFYGSSLSALENYIIYQGIDVSDADLRLITES